MSADSAEGEGWWKLGGMILLAVVILVTMIGSIVTSPACVERPYDPGEVVYFTLDPDTPMMVAEWSIYQPNPGWTRVKYKDKDGHLVYENFRDSDLYVKPTTQE